MAHRLSCFAGCGVFLDQGLNPCPLHWQLDSYPLCHKGSPRTKLLTEPFKAFFGPITCPSPLIHTKFSSAPGPMHLQFPLPGKLFFGSFLILCVN